jgi:hypothetical protein
MPALRLTPVRTHPTAFDPSSVKVAMNLRLDACIVPSEAEGARISYAGVVVLDHFLDDTTRQKLLAFLSDNDDSDCLHRARCKGPSLDAPQTMRVAQSGELPMDRWQRRTADAAGEAATWGLQQHALDALADGHPPAIVEVQSRVQALYPEWTVCHLPSAAIQGPDSTSCGVDCSAILANATMAGDSLGWHVDADPTSFPSPSPWVNAFGDYVNGEPGKPLLVSLILYLNDEWPREWAAETFFLDAATDSGVLVRPRPCRAVLMHQDVVHKASTPSAAANGAPRFSLVLKLALVPRVGQEVALRRAGYCLSRPEWGAPVSFGSAARVEAVKRELAREVREGGGEHGPEEC